jgi:hypothetical protein
MYIHMNIWTKSKKVYRRMCTGYVGDLNTLKSWYHFYLWYFKFIVGWIYESGTYDMEGQLCLTKCYWFDFSITKKDNS